MSHEIIALRPGALEVFLICITQRAVYNADQSVEEFLVSVVVHDKLSSLLQNVEVGPWRGNSDSDGLVLDIRTKPRQQTAVRILKRRHAFLTKIPEKLARTWRNANPTSGPPAIS